MVLSGPTGRAAQGCLPGHIGFPSFQLGQRAIKSEFPVVYRIEQWAGTPSSSVKFRFAWKCNTDDMPDCTLHKAARSQCQDKWTAEHFSLLGLRRQQLKNSNPAKICPGTQTRRSVCPSTSWGHRGRDSLPLACFLEELQDSRNLLSWDWGHLEHYCGDHSGLTLPCSPIAITYLNVGKFVNQSSGWTVLKKEKKTASLWRPTIRAKVTSASFHLLKVKL